jgi:hypothetical protein
MTRLAIISAEKMERILPKYIRDTHTVEGPLNSAALNYPIVNLSALHELKDYRKDKGYKGRPSQIHI